MNDDEWKRRMTGDALRFLEWHMECETCGEPAKKAAWPSAGPNPLIHAYCELHVPEDSLYVFPE